MNFMTTLIFLCFPLWKFLSTTAKNNSIYAGYWLEGLENKPDYQFWCGQHFGSKNIGVTSA